MSEEARKRHVHGEARQCHTVLDDLVAAAAAALFLPTGRRSHHCTLHPALRILPHPHLHPSARNQLAFAHPAQLTAMEEDLARRFGVRTARHLHKAKVLSGQVLGDSGWQHLRRCRRCASAFSTAARAAACTAAAVWPQHEPLGLAARPAQRRFQPAFLSSTNPASV